MNVSNFGITLGQFWQICKVILEKEENNFVIIVICQYHSAQFKGGKN